MYQKIQSNKTDTKIENLNSSISITEITCIIKNLPHRKTPGPYSFTGELFQIFK